ncbi:hypothetical protein BIS06_22820, partial [Halomonas sp. BBD48]|nr:hypothetical protein [Halomonas sp. BBD48]
DKAPLSLPEALEEGWHHFEAQDCLAQLLNTFVDTQLLDSRLSVGIEASPFSITLADGRRIDGPVTPSLGFFHTADAEPSSRTESSTATQRVAEQDETL